MPIIEASSTIQSFGFRLSSIFRRLAASFIASVSAWIPVSIASTEAAAAVLEKPRTS